MRLWLLAIAFLGAAALSARDVRVARKGSSEPFFISAGAATQPNGAFKWDALPENLQIVLRTQLQERAARRRTVASDTSDGEPCDVRVLTTQHLGVSTRSWEDVFNGATSIYRGTIVDLVPGFNYTRPVTLVTMRVDRASKRADGYPASGTVRFISSGADFTIGGERFCNAGSHSGFVPQIGDQVLLLPSLVPFEAEGTFQPIGDEQIVFGRGRDVFVPAAFQTEPALRNKTLDQIGRSAPERTRGSLR